MDRVSYTKLVPPVQKNTTLKNGLFLTMFLLSLQKIALNGFFEVDGNALSWHVAGIAA